jgi:hypothetical protein
LVLPKKPPTFPPALPISTVKAAFFAILKTQLKRHFLLPDAAVVRRRKDQVITKRMRYSIRAAGCAPPMYVQPCGQAAAHAEELVGFDSCRQLSTAPLPSALAANGVDHLQLFEECFAYCARSHPHERQLLNLSLHASRLAYEHRACQIVPAINAKLNLLRAKKIGTCKSKDHLSPCTMQCQ